MYLREHIPGMVCVPKNLNAETERLYRHEGKKDYTAKEMKQICGEIERKYREEQTETFLRLVGERLPRRYTKDPVTKGRPRARILNSLHTAASDLLAAEDLLFELDSETPTLWKARHPGEESATEPERFHVGDILRALAEAAKKMEANPPHRTAKEKPHNRRAAISEIVSLWIRFIDPQPKVGDGTGLSDIVDRILREFGVPPVGVRKAVSLAIQEANEAAEYKRHCHEEGKKRDICRKVRDILESP
jgi:hypothetical protein